MTRMKQSDSFYDKIYRAVQQIPPGKVATYGQVDFAFGGDEEQQRLLEAEGVEVIDHHVDLKKYQAATAAAVGSPRR